jgi:hypothetical protein
MSNLARWYDITEMVDPQFNVVAKVPKSALKALQ